MSKQTMMTGAEIAMSMKARRNIRETLVILRARPILPGLESSSVVYVAERVAVRASERAQKRSR